LLRSCRAQRRLIAPAVKLLTEFGFLHHVDPKASPRADAYPQGEGDRSAGSSTSPRASARAASRANLFNPSRMKNGATTIVPGE
jgi:hypothetical protein